MTLLALGAIFAVLVVIARELRLLRKQRDGSQKPAMQCSAAKYKARIFTFHRSGWIWPILSFQEWVLLIAGVVIWFKFIFPELQQPTWKRYSITALGFLVWFVIVESDPLRLWHLMDSYDERVYRRVLTSEEREELEAIANSDRCTFTDDPEEQDRILAEEREQIEQIYRAKGL